MFRAVSSAALVVALTACNTPPPPPDDNNNNNTEGKTCEVEGQDVQLPDEDAVRPAGGAVDFSCVGNPRAIAEGQLITLEGCVDIFGLGGVGQYGLKVGVFAQDQDPKSATPAYGEEDIAFEDDAPDFDCAGADANNPVCLAQDCDKGIYYRVEGVPSNIPVIMKVYAPDDDSVIDTYTYDVVFFEDTAVDGVVVYEASLIYRQTYDSIPTLAGRIVDGQQTIGDDQGRGVIAGEIHDCSDAIVQGASVMTSEFDSSTKITYFDGNEEDPKPKLTRLSTNTDGLYVILNANTDAGSNVHTITAGVLDPNDGEKCLSLSSRTVRAYPDSVTIVTLRGDLPVAP